MTRKGLVSTRSILVEEGTNLHARRWWAVTVALLSAWPAMAQDRPATEEIGSWLLTCAAAEPCRLRHRTPLLPLAAGAPTAQLEVVQRGRQFVPVVALRGLSMAQAVGGLLAVEAHVSLQFDPDLRTDLTCGLSGSAIVCTPPDAGREALAEHFAKARGVVVQISLTLPAGTALPEQSRPLELQRTAEALARFRATAPANEAVPVVPGLDWRGLLDRLARDAGFQHGLADLLPSPTEPVQPLQMRRNP